MTGNLYSDIQTRTGGNIYIGVVGPVRTGKSTFINRFMQTLVLENIESEYQRQRAIDELPQSAAGKTIMTTEPKFIPEDAVGITLPNNVRLNVRMIDCVGYIVPSAIGYIENEAPRMVRTPWFSEEVPFNMAAEVGTEKVITDHSTVGLVITTDGSITGIDRTEYAAAEERVIKELKKINKPFAVVLNCTNPDSDTAQTVKREIEEKYGVTPISLNCLDLTESDIKQIMTQLLYSFPIKEISVDMPKWIVGLDRDHWLKKSVVNSILDCANKVKNIGDINSCMNGLAECEYVKNFTIDNVDLGSGCAKIDVNINDSLFYKVLGEVTGFDIENESSLMPCMIELAEMKRKFEKVKSALDEVEATGYGIVMPEMQELMLDEPEIVKQGGKYGVRLKASAPSIHMMRADIKTEVSPIVGSEKQSEELVRYLLEEFEENPEKIWNSNIFGKSLHELVNEGLHNKLYRMPSDARLKLQETITRIINEGCSGLICIIL